MGESGIYFIGNNAIRVNTPAAIAKYLHKCGCLARRLRE